MMIEEETEDFTKFITNVLTHDKKSASGASSTPSIAKRLIFNDTFQIHEAMKRKSIGEEENEEKRLKEDREEPIIQSPWEIRRIRSNLSTAKHEIAQLQDYIEKQHNVREQTVTMFNIEKEALQRQKANDAKVISELEHKLSSIRKREQELKSAAIQSSSDYEQLKLSTDSKLHYKDKMIAQLEEEIAQLKDVFDKDKKKSMQLRGEVESNMSGIEFKNQEYQRALTELREEISILRKSKEKLIKTEAELEIAKVKLHSLESEISSYTEFQTQMKAMQRKLVSIPEMEMEMKHLRQEAQTLRENVQNKLILEEQVYDLKSKLANSNNRLKDMSNIQLEHANANALLQEWKAVGKDFNKDNLTTPKDLRLYIEELQKNELILTTEKLKAQSNLKSVEFELSALKQENTKFSMQISDLRTSLKQHQNLLHRVQKKLLLVAKERDCFKSLMDSYEQDLTMMNINNMSGPEVQLKERIDGLERMVDGYKELVSSLEKDLQQAQPHLHGPNAPAPVRLEQLNRLQEENASLQRENEKLTKRCDECETLLEKLHQNEASPATKPEKVLHFIHNPLAISQNAYKEDVTRLHAEIERLKKKIKKLEEGGASDITQTQNLTTTAELLMLREKTKADEIKMERLKEVYKNSSQEFREVCYIMLGYKIDRTNTKSYRLTNMYAENENDYLSFEYDNGTLQLLQTPYSQTLDELVHTYLRQYDSIPAFLCALTLDLFKRTTMMDMGNSITM